MEKRNDALVVEMFLRKWEDICFMEQQKALAERRPISPSLKNAESFRDYLLSYRAGDAFDLHRFIPFDDEKTLTWMGAAAAAPVLITDWVSGSKRIFRLSAEMQKRFESIGFGNMRFSDVQFPFPVFGVQLATPLKDTRGTDYGFIFLWLSRLIASKPVFRRESVNINFISLQESLKEYGGLEREKRVRTLRDLMDPERINVGIRSANKLINQYNKMSEKYGVVGAFSIPTDNLEGATIESVIGHFASHEGRWGSQKVYQDQLRIVLNLCLYLQSLPPGAEKEEGVEWKTEYIQKRVMKASGSIISKWTEVCDIVGHHIIDSMIDDRRSGTHAGGGWEMEPQWRRAHARRPPGHGNDPTAEKTVKVRHYLIREDLAEQGRPIRGSVAEVR